MNEDIRVILMDLPTTVRGFVYEDSTYCPVIVLNARMPHEIQQHTYMHELEHINHGDLHNLDYREYSA